MAGDVLKKVKSGDPLRIPAQTFNVFIDMAKDYQGRKMCGGQFAQREFSQSGIVLVKNSSLVDCNRFAVLGIDGPLFSPTVNLESFKNKVVLSCRTPDEYNHLGKFVILQEPIQAGKIGSAWIAGVCPAQINIGHSSHKFADVADGDSTVLQSCFSGTARIIWAEYGTGIKWAIVHIGLPPTFGTVRGCFPARLRTWYGEPYTDCRYYVQPIRPAVNPLNPTGPIIWEDVPHSGPPGYNFVTATNLQETISNSHYLPATFNIEDEPHAKVIVFWMNDQSQYQQPMYFFNGPGIIVG